VSDVPRLRRPRLIGEEFVLIQRLQIPQPLDDVGIEAGQVELVDQDPGLPRAWAKNALRLELTGSRRIPDVATIASRIRQLTAHIAAEGHVGDELFAT
jgi:hypothetical protein